MGSLWQCLTGIVLCLACIAYIVIWMIIKFLRNIALDDTKTSLKLKMKQSDHHGSRDENCEDDIPDEVKQKFEHNMACFVSYDAERATSIGHFRLVQMNTECIFAKDARLWGSCDYDGRLSLEENVERSIPMFMKFTAICEMRCLDGFVFEIPCEEFQGSPEKFGEGVHRVLTVVSDHDPAGYNCMSKSFIGKRGWCFEFNRETFFITTFSPCYPDSHSRYVFGASSSFILFQPEISFALHNIPDDTPYTNWENPKSVRDRIRVAYKENGREYFIRNTVIYPPAHDIVKPLGMHDAIIEWWERSENNQNGKSATKTTEGKSKCPFIP